MAEILAAILAAFAFFSGISGNRGRDVKKTQTNNTPPVLVANGSPTAIPTPALLPGLIGLGLGALRKRKSEEVETEA